MCMYVCVCVMSIFEVNVAKCLKKYNTIKSLIKKNLKLDQVLNGSKKDLH